LGVAAQHGEWGVRCHDRCRLQRRRIPASDIVEV
jgi:hypothetical protein